MEFGLVQRLAYPGHALRRAPRLLMSDCETTIAVARKACLHPRPGVYPMSGIICSQGGHLIAGQMAKAFSSAYTPRHLCRPGILASLLKAVQSKKALLPMYLSEGGIASSTRAAQFTKALTRIVWRVVGRRTSLRLVQCTKVNSGISSTLAPIATKCFVRASAVIPAELRQPGASSLVLACSVDPRGMEAHSR